MLDESKSIKAKDIVDDPDSVYGLMRSHMLLVDTSMTTSFSNMVDAIEILVNAGWDSVNMAYDSGTMIVMMKNLNYKRKNG